MVSKNKLKDLRGLLLGLSFSLVSFGCAKSDCSIHEDHVHEYICCGYVRDIQNEHLTCDGFSWTENYKYLNRKDLELQKFLDKKDLLVIENNVEKIQSVIEASEEYIEYEYVHYELETKTKTDYKTGKISVKTDLKRKKDWTTDANHASLTGKARLCIPMYQACKVEKNEDKYVLIRSDYVDNVLDIMDEYPYFKMDYCKTVYTDISLEDVMEYQRTKK